MDALVLLERPDPGSGALVLIEDRRPQLILEGFPGPKGLDGTIAPGSGVTQGQADARYIKQSAINAANGVAGLDANVFLAENELPLPPVTLTVLFANQMT